MDQEKKIRKVGSGVPADGGKLSTKQLETFFNAQGKKPVEEKDFLKKFINHNVQMKKGSSLKRLDQPFQFKFINPIMPNIPQEVMFHKRRMLSNTQKRSLGIYKLEKENLDYKSLIPLNDLWKGYIQQLCTNKTDLGPTLVKADLHGSIITVTQTKNVAIFGLSGIVIYETLHTFRIVTEDNKYKALPKQGTRFTIEVEGVAYHLFGNHLIVRPHDKATKKFKSKPSIEL